MLCGNCRGKKKQTNKTIRQRVGPGRFCQQSLSADQQPFKSKEATSFKNGFIFQGSVEPPQKNTTLVAPDGTNPKS